MRVESDILDFISNYLYVNFSYIIPSFYCLKMEMFSVIVAPIENESQKRQGKHDLVFLRNTCASVVSIQFVNLKFPRI